MYAVEKAVSLIYFREDYSEKISQSDFRCVVFWGVFRILEM